MALFKNRKTNKLQDLNGSYGSYPGADASPGHRLNPNIGAKAQMNGRSTPGTTQPHSVDDYRNKQATLARTQQPIPGVSKPGE